MPVEQNLIDLVWADKQPAATSNPIITLDLKYAGETVEQKWNKIKSQLQDKKSHALVVSALDEIACRY